MSLWKSDPAYVQVFCCVNDTDAERQGHLMEFELEAEDVAQGLVLTHVRLDQRDEELVLVWTALVHFQNDVQHTVRVQVETSCIDKGFDFTKERIS